MHKKLEAELVSLAHSILQMKNKDDVSALHKKAHDIYEKLSLLKFVDEYINTTPNNTESKEEIIDKIADVFTDKEEVISLNLIENVEGEKEISSETHVEEILTVEDTSVKEDVNEIPIVQNTLEEELNEAISADVATELFERATKQNSKIEEVSETKMRSLNDTLFKNNLQVGLNDRIAFVKHLFEGNQEDFNRVLSQLNTFKNESEAKNFINMMVKPDYDWSDKEEYEERLINLIERRFL